MAARGLKSQVGNYTGLRGKSRSQRGGEAYYNFFESSESQLQV